MSKFHKRFNRSQAAHKRLAKKHHTDNPSRDFNSFVLSDYHSTVTRRQAKEKRILSMEERKKVFKACHAIAFEQYL